MEILITSELERRLSIHESWRSTDEKAWFVRVAYHLNFLDLAQGSLESPKSATLSERKRLLGNEYYAGGRYDAAANLYSWALLLAPPATEQLKLAFGNRSAAYFKLKLRGPCVKDVERALALGCDGKLREKLEARRAAASNLEQREEEEERAPFGPPPQVHPDLPGASDAVQIVRSEEWGWHMVAARDVVPGETIVFEKPYLTQICGSQRIRRCYECCGLGEAMVPCEGCSRAMFCDEECRSRSLEGGHRFECPLMELLAKCEVSSNLTFAFRSALRARSKVSSWMQFRSMVRSCERMLQDDRFIYDHGSYASFHGLETLQAKRSGSEFFSMCCSASVLLQLLMKFTGLFTDIESSGDIWFFGGLIVHHIMAVETNLYGIQLLTHNEKENFAKCNLIGFNINILLSRVNHSCAPNVKHLTRGKMSALIAVRPVKKGQQIFNSYGAFYETENYFERQMKLILKYKFVCQCPACKDFWPLYTESVSKIHIKCIRKKMKNINLDWLEKLMKGDKTVALKMLPLLYENAKLLESFAPCIEFLCNQEMINRSLQLFSNF